MIHDAMARLVEAVLKTRAKWGGKALLRERLGLGAQPLPADIWVHGASVGELKSARRVIEALAEDCSLLITSNTETARDMVAGWGLNARIAPLDLPKALEGFLDAVQPRLQVTVEGEYWPLRSRELARRAIPQAMIGARMSRKSAANWARLPRIIRPMLQRIAALSAQDSASEKRLLSLGLPPSAALPRLDLKLLGPSEITPPPDGPARDVTVLAASTHEGEEATILDTFLAAQATYPLMRLILAIRHPDRGDEVAAIIAKRGVPVLRRSRGDDLTGPILLADTLGEMDRWYAEAGICIVGGSLTDRGGHTPWEPAAYRCALLHGPHVSTYTDSYAALIDAGAARQIDADTLAGTLSELVGAPQIARDMGKAARQVLDSRAGDPAALVAQLRGLARGNA
ncbi:3-deoxy-D-manno-octulosonic acid transferase [Paracoccus caeni]|uniref:3-deoxy-D-manno-octulosonic acid transferase n=1 Tax=Paracoccus caeni TaxID=657651 RepID=A0A934SIQ2_9RHOB|nr:glycosyltransferase N-terminal domain-containing protein [Paracoccus caeni]MBK4215173.1 3-deoxy-D-manno-octulosonic acid transferase [Paracoccus caeni]